MQNSKYFLPQSHDEQRPDQLYNRSVLQKKEDSHNRLETIATTIIRRVQLIQTGQAGACGRNCLGVVVPFSNNLEVFVTQEVSPGDNSLTITVEGELIERQSDRMNVQHCTILTVE
jgi:hypothetical protein